MASHPQSNTEALSGEGSISPLLHGLARLRERAAKLGDDSLPLVERMMAAAQAAERQITDQKARIGYLEGLSNTDELTGLLNRRGFHQALGATLARAQRHGETGVLVLCDLDRFKAVNDRLGHLAGDAVLAAVAGQLRRGTRRSDTMARIGGDEFAILLTDTGREPAGERLRRLDTEINALKVDWKGGPITVSASFGLAAYDGDSTAQGLLFLADRNLYTRKHPQLIYADE